jgi:hypothetical protein
VTVDGEIYDSQTPVREGASVVTQYRNLGGDSGVRTYNLADDAITVGFSDGSFYVYTYASAGPHNVKQMKSLAVRGRGLNAFINTRVKHLYATKRPGYSRAW